MKNKSKNICDEKNKTKDCAWNEEKHEIGEMPHEKMRGAALRTNDHKKTRQKNIVRSQSVASKAEPNIGRTAILRSLNNIILTHLQRTPPAASVNMLSQEKLQPVKLHSKGPNGSPCWTPSDESRRESNRVIRWEFIRGIREHRK